MCWKAGSFWLGFTASAVAKLYQKRKVPANFTFNETLFQTVTSVSTKHCISGREVCTKQSAPALAVENYVWSRVLCTIPSHTRGGGGSVPAVLSVLSRQKSGDRSRGLVAGRSLCVRLKPRALACGIAKIGNIPASGKLRNQDYLAKQCAHLLFLWVPAP